MTLIHHITIQDENDFAPVFSASKLNATIAENARVGSLVIWLNVTDLDSGANSQISYRIVSGNSENAFIISSGEVRTQDLLDREGIDSYELVVWFLATSLNISLQGSRDSLQSFRILRILKLYQLYRNHFKYM